MKRKETVLVICAHNDDQIIGAGGTLAKYAKEGKIIKTVIFSFGEQSHPHLKPGIITSARIKESKDADRIIGAKGLTYLGLKDGKIKQEINEKVKNKLRGIIKREKPLKIFTNSIEDPHPDHKAVGKLIKELIEGRVIKCDVYSFNVWGFINIRKRNTPKLIVDTTDTFSKKIEAFKAHKSQKITLSHMIIKIYVKDLINGWNNDSKYAEVFHRTG